MVVSMASAGFGAPTAANDTLETQQTVKEIRKELATLPYYGVFDNLAFQVDGDTVTLYGQVLRGSTRKSAEKRVAKIDGISTVVNRIQILPASPNDDRIRARAYRQIFGSGSLYRYAMGANPSMHLIVSRGHITLEGVVDSKVDSQLAYTIAQSIPGVFSVTNNLAIKSEL